MVELLEWKLARSRQEGRERMSEKKKRWSVDKRGRHQLTMKHQLRMWRASNDGKNIGSKKTRYLSESYDDFPSRVPSHLDSQQSDCVCLEGRESVCVL